MRTAVLVAGFIAAVLAAFALGLYVGSPTPGPRERERTQQVDAPARTTVVEVAAQSVDASQDEDSPQTLADTLRLSGDFAQSAALYALASRADEPALLQLLDEAGGIEQLSERETATSVLYARYADLAPASAVDHALTRGGSDAQDVLVAIFHIWCRSDLDAALARAIDLPEEFRAPIAVAMLRARDDLPDEERRHMAAELNVTPALERMLAAEAAVRWTDDPQAGWSIVQQMPDSHDRTNQLAAIIHAWSQRDPEAALAAIDDVTNGAVRDMLAATVAQEWAEADVEGALAWALGHEKARGQAQVLRHVLRKLARSEPTRALDIAASIPAQQERVHTLLPIVSEWAARDLKGAVAWFDTQRDRTVRATALPFIASAYANGDWRGAADWMNRLSDTERREATSHVAVAMLQTDPERAGRLVLEQGEPQPLMQFVAVWSQMDPAATATWIDANVEDSGNRGTLLGITLQTWIGADQSEALRFIDRMEPGPAYDQAAISTIGMLGHDRAAAERLLEKIDESAMRTHAQTLIGDMP